MFVDFYKNSRSLEAVKILHKRRLVVKRLAARVYRPMTRALILTKPTMTEAYADKMIEEAKGRGRFIKDKYFPHDETLIKYWVMDDESLTMEEEFGMDIVMDAMLEVESKQSITEMTASGGIFGADAGPSMMGFGGIEQARLGDDMVAGANPTPAAAPAAAAPDAKGKGKGATTEKGKGKGKEGKSEGTTPGEAGTGGTLKALTPTQKANAMCKDLTKSASEINRQLLDVEGVLVHPTLIKELEETKEQMEIQMRAIKGLMNTKKDALKLEDIQIIIIITTTT